MWGNLTCQGFGTNVSYESIHKIDKFKPFENGWVDEPISIGLNLVSLEFIPWICG